MSKRFYSLTWLSAGVEFVFKFASLLAELLLGFGLVVSAADTISGGTYLRGYPQLIHIFAWSQATALELGSGVTLTSTIEAYKAGDKVKGKCYLALTLILAFVGAVMLCCELVSTTTGAANVADSVLWISVLLSILRSIATIGYIALSRTKGISFSDSIPEKTQEGILTREEVMLILEERLSAIELEQRIEAVAGRVVISYIPTIDQVREMATKVLEENKVLLIPEKSSREEKKAKESTGKARGEEKLKAVQEFLATHESYTVRDVAEAIGVSVSNAHAWIDKAKRSAS